MTPSETSSGFFTPSRRTTLSSVRDYTVEKRRLPEEDRIVRMIQGVDAGGHWVSGD